MATRDETLRQKAANSGSQNSHRRFRALAKRSTRLASSTSHNFVVARIVRPCRRASRRQSMYEYFSALLDVSPVSRVKSVIYGHHSNVIPLRSANERAGCNTR